MLASPAVTFTEAVPTVLLPVFTATVREPVAVAPGLTVTVYTLGVALVAAVPPLNVALPTLRLMESFELKAAEFKPVESLRVMVVPDDVDPDMLVTPWISASNVDSESNSLY